MSENKIEELDILYKNDNLFVKEDEKSITIETYFSSVSREEQFIEALLIL